jgi:hypothetical protein
MMYPAGGAVGGLYVVAGAGGGGMNCMAIGCGGGGGWGSGTLPYPGGNGGYWGATGGYGLQQSYMQNQMAANQDAMFQRQGLASQFGQAANNSQMYAGGYGAGYGGYGSAGFSPMNMGASIGFGVGVGF